MSPLRALLLLLLTLPGLLVPAGFGLGRCECTGSLRLVRDGAAPACAVTPEAAPAPSCCHRPASREPSGESVVSHRGKDCVCKATVVPPAPAKLAPGTKQVEAPLALLGAAPPLAVPPLRLVGRVWSCVSRGPPAPGTDRNLPLLL